MLFLSDLEDELGESINTKADAVNYCSKGCLDLEEFSYSGMSIVSFNPHHSLTGKRNPTNRSELCLYAKQRIQELVPESKTGSDMKSYLEQTCWTLYNELIDNDITLLYVSFRLFKLFTILTIYSIVCCILSTIIVIIMCVSVIVSVFIPKNVKPVN